MSFNGGGTFQINSSGQPVVGGTTITSTAFNAFTADVGSGLSNVICKDGQTTVTANLPMATYKHTGVGPASALTDYARYDQLQNSSPKWLTSVSGVDTITATASPTPAAYAAGQTFRFVSAGDNTGAVTLNISSLGAKAVTKNGTTALSAGDIPSGMAVEVIYDGTRFQLGMVGLRAGDIGVSVQAYDAELAALAGLTSAANKVPMFSGSGTATLLDFKDEDNMASDSATAVPSQQSVKAYVDTQVASVSGITLDTAKASTSGTDVLFSSIPAGTKRITIMLDGVSKNSTAGILVQIGASGGIESSGYVSACSRTTAVATSSIGFAIIDAMIAANTINGAITLTLLKASTNTWVSSSNIALSGSSCASGAGAKSLSGTLDRLRLVATNGTDTFDAGTVNIAYE